MDKPRGFAVIGEGDAVQLLHDLPLIRLPGVGPSLADRLKVDGFFTVGDVQRRSIEDMTLRYGNMGEHLANLARGIDRRHVNIDRESKSISAETTFLDDVADAAELRRRLWPLCEKVADRLKVSGLSGRVVTLKLKTARFKLRTRRQTITKPTQLAEVIFRTADPLLREEAVGSKFRLIGVGVEGFDDAAVNVTADLFAAQPIDDTEHLAEVERAMDVVRAKFGRAAIRKGRADR